MTPRTSTIPQQNINNSSSIPPTPEQSYMNYVSAQAKPQTTAQIKAHGDVKVKLGVLWLIGVVSVILGTFGCISFLITPDKSKDLWVIIGPIISASLTGVVAFLTGEKQGSK